MKALLRDLGLGLLWYLAFVAVAKRIDEYGTPFVSTLETIAVSGLIGAGIFTVRHVRKKSAAARETGPQ